MVQETLIFIINKMTSLLMSTMHIYFHANFGYARLKVPYLIFFSRQDLVINLPDWHDVAIAKRETVMRKKDTHERREDC